MSQRDQSNTQLQIEIPRSRARSPLEEPCPECGAAPGQECMTKTSARPAATHQARWKLARFLPTGGER